MDPEVPGSSPGGGTIFPSRTEEAPPLRSAHARYARHTAGALGYAFRSLDGADGYLFEVRDGARRAYFAAGAGSPYAFNDARANSIARDKAFAQTVLAENGLPTIRSDLFFTNTRHAALRAPGREPSDAAVFARNATYPLFCKPIDGAQGAFAEIVRDTAQFERYLARVAEAHYAILAQPVIVAPEHRIFVLNGEVLFAYRKLPPRLTGDGAANVASLMGRGAFDYPETVRARDSAGKLFALADVPPAGAALVLEGAANRALGGGSEPPATQAPAHLARLALAAVATLGLRMAAVDIFDRSEGDGGPVIIEVNCNPAISTLEDHDRWDLIETIWRANFDAALT